MTTQELLAISIREALSRAQMHEEYLSNKEIAQLIIDALGEDAENVAEEIIKRI